METIYIIGGFVTLVIGVLVVIKLTYQAIRSFFRLATFFVKFGFLALAGLAFYIWITEEVPGLIPSLVPDVINYEEQIIPYRDSIHHIDSLEIEHLKEDKIDALPITFQDLKSKR